MLPPLHPEEIKAQLRMRYGSLVKFEKAKSLPCRAVTQLLLGKATMPTAEAIADELDIPVHRVSSHYHSMYYKLSTSPRHRRDGDPAHRQNAKVL
jgi:lambda repressor-like predicted transcriptional regulator